MSDHSSINNENSSRSAYRELKLQFRAYAVEHGILYSQLTSIENAVSATNDILVSRLNYPPHFSFFEIREVVEMQDLFIKLLCDNTFPGLNTRLNGYPMRVIQLYINFLKDVKPEKYTAPDPAPEAAPILPAENAGQALPNAAERGAGDTGANENIPNAAQPPCDRVPSPAAQAESGLQPADTVAEPRTLAEASEADVAETFLRYEQLTRKISRETVKDCMDFACRYCNSNVVLLGKKDLASAGTIRHEISGLIFSDGRNDYRKLVQSVVDDYFLFLKSYKGPIYHYETIEELKAQIGAKLDFDVMIGENDPKPDDEQPETAASKPDTSADMPDPFDLSEATPAHPVPALDTANGADECEPESPEATLLPPQHKYGNFYSWEIIDDYTAVKTCDKTFFEFHNTGVPKEIYWFFECETLKNGSSMSLKFTFKGKEYTGLLTKDMQYPWRVHINWNKALSDCFTEYHSVPSVKAVFKKIGPGIFEIDFIDNSKRTSLFKHRYGIFDSWEIVDEYTAVKTCDEPFFDYNGSGISENIYWFFGCDAQDYGSMEPIKLTFKGTEYSGYLSKNIGSARIFWYKALSDRFAEYRSDPSVKAVFRKTGPGAFEISFGDEAEQEAVTEDTAVTEQIQPSFTAETTDAAQTPSAEQASAAPVDGTQLADACEADIAETFLRLQENEHELTREAVSESFDFARKFFKIQETILGTKDLALLKSLRGKVWDPMFINANALSAEEYARRKQVQSVVNDYYLFLKGYNGTIYHAEQPAEESFTNKLERIETEVLTPNDEPLTPDAVANDPQLGGEFKRIPWDKYELALLFEQYNRLSKGEPLGKAERELSEKLRRKAVIEGKTISGKFRNEAGMHFYLLDVKCLFETDQKILRKPQKSLVEMFNTYMFDHPEYEAILARAHAILESKASDPQAKDPRRIDPAMVLIPAKQPPDGNVPADTPHASSDSEVCDPEITQTASDQPEAIAAARDENLRLFIDWWKTQYAAGVITAKPIKFETSLGILEETDAMCHSCSLTETDLMFITDTHLITNVTNSISLRSGEYFKDIGLYLDGITFCANYCKYRRAVPSAVLPDTSGTKAQLREDHDGTVQGSVKTVTVTQPTDPDPLIAAIKRQGLQFIDNREKEGCLWIPGDESIQAIIERIGEENSVLFRYAPNGGRCTDRQPAWFTSMYGTVQSDPADEARHDARIEQILSEKFRGGFRKNSFIDMRKFRTAWQDALGEVCEASDDDIKCTLSQICLDTGDRWYLPELLFNSDDCESVISQIRMNFDAGKHVMFYEPLYRSVKGELSYALMTQELFEKSIRYTLKGKYFFFDRYLSDQLKPKIDTAEELKAALEAEGRPMAVTALIERLPHLPKNSIEAVLKNDPHFIRNSKDKDTGGEFYHIEMLPLTSEEFDLVEKTIAELIEEDGYACRSEVFKRSWKKDPDIIQRLAPYSDPGLWSVIGSRFYQKFGFSGTVASPRGTFLAANDVLTLYCKKHLPFTLQELGDFCKEYELPAAVIPTAYTAAFRISEQRFVAKNEISFDIDATDDAIELACPGDYAPLSLVNVLDAFPQVGYTWSRYMLEQYLLDHSRRFGVRYGQNHYPSGIIFRRGKGLESGDEIISRILADNGVQLKTDIAAQWLYNNGYAPSVAKTWATESILKRAAQILKEREK